MSPAVEDPRTVAVEVARREIAARTWAMTGQFLDVHQVETDEHGRPRVARLDDRLAPDGFAVYFSFVDEPYHFVIHVGRGDSGALEVCGMEIQGGTRVYLVVKSETRTTAEVTAKLGLSPTEEHRLGDRIGPSALRRRAHAWILEPQAGVPGSVDEKVRVLLEQVAPAGSRFPALGPDCEVKVVIVFTGWWSLGTFGSFEFEPDVVQRIAALGASVWLDLYASGPAMLEDD